MEIIVTTILFLCIGCVLTLALILIVLLALITVGYFGNARVYSTEYLSDEENGRVESTEEYGPFKFGHISSA